MIRSRNPLNILVREITVHPVDQRAHLPGVDEEHLAAPVAEFVVLLVAGDKPEAGRDLGGVEELPGNAIMQSTRSASMMFFRISPSPDWFEDMDPFASTKPAMPVGARWWMKCWTQA